MNDGYVPIDGHRLHYIDAGEPTEKPPAVCLHGGIVDAAALSWGGAIGPLSADRRVIALDLLGYGDSARPAEADYSTAAHTDRLLTVLDALGIERATLAGLSLGGALALGATLEAPGRVERLVLVDSHGLGASVPRGRLTYLLSRIDAPNKAAFAVLRRSRAATRASLDNIVVAPDRLEASVVGQLYDLVRRDHAGRAFREWRRHEVTWNGYRTDFSDRLSSVGVPTLLVHGEHDEVVPITIAQRAADRIPDATLAAFENCAHWPPRERPERFVETLRAWW
jgi:pimeloyl-ACP methyl ester carboxylesterase